MFCPLFVERGSHANTDTPAELCGSEESSHSDATSSFTLTLSDYQLLTCDPFTIIKPSDNPPPSN